MFHRVHSDPYSEVLYCEECRTKKFSVVCCEMFALFKAINKIIVNISRFDTYAVY